MGSLRDEIRDIFANPPLGEFELDPAAFRQAQEQKVVRALDRLAEEIEKLRD